MPTFPIAGDHQHTSPARVIVRPQSNPLSAVVFYPDDFDEDADDKNYDNIFGFSSEPNPTEAVFAQLADKLSKDPENVSKLALIAAAFSPRGYEINMAHINQIGCLTVDNRHLDIEVVVCDQGDCNSLLIPAHFKNECDMNDLGGLEDCVLKNVDILNRESEELVMARKEETFEDSIGAQRALDVLSSLGSAPPKVMPDWWIYPRLSEESEECDLIQDLLNGRDLEEMVRGLAMAIELQNESRNIVQSAIVRDIGPAGIVLQAQVEDMFKDVVLMEIPIPFASGPVELNDGLRSIRDEVLGMVSASVSFS